MTTVINNPGEGKGDSSSGAGIIIGVIVAIVIVVLFLLYGLPAIRGESSQNGSLDVNLKLPAGENSSGTTY